MLATAEARRKIWHIEDWTRLAELIRDLQAWSIRVRARVSLHDACSQEVEMTSMVASRHNNMLHDSLCLVSASVSALVASVNAAARAIPICS